MDRAEDACRFLRSGSTVDELAVTLPLLDAASDLQWAASYFLGVGIGAFCPNQAHKFRE